MTGPRPIVAALLLCVAASVVALATQWRAEADEFDRAGAREFTAEALEDAGLDGVEVSGRVRETEYRPRTFAPDDPPLHVFRTTARTDGGTVELFVHGPTGRAVYLRDVATDGGPLLDDTQYRRLRAFAWTDEAGVADRRRLAGTTAAVLVVLVAIGLSLVDRRAKMEP